MSVSNTNEQFNEYRWQWRRCRDVIAGKDAIIQSGRSRERYVGSLFDPVYTTDLYLPRLSNQSDQEYFSYVERAAFFNATGRTLDAMTGLIFGKDPMYSLPGAIDRFAEDITLTGTNLREFSEQVVEEQVAIGRVGVLVDYPDNVPAGLSVAEIERLNIRPFLRMYKGENIINWRTTSIGGRDVLTMVVLMETVYEPIDEFTSNDVTVYRVLTLEPEGYRVRVFNEENDVVSDIFPRRNGAPLSYIPFVILGANSCSTDVQKPPLLDLVDSNLAHYRNSADYEHGLHFTGLPTPYVSGVQLAEGQALALGSTSAWVFPDPAAKAGFLEFTGDGLKTIREAMKDKEHRMAVLGARMLADDKRTAEAFGTIELKTAGERSVLASISRAASDGLTRCLNWMAEWVGAAPEVEFALNTDYGAMHMQPQMLTAVVGAYQTGALPLSVLFENLKKGEIVRPDMDFEEYEAQIADEGPNLSLPAPTAAPEPDDSAAGLVANLRERFGL
jgi:hypothetical protein